jgi:GDP-4-dehydro-6-deoxy-D-mannose reductase
MKSKALLIGGTGFVGSHLEQHLLPNYNVVATGRNADIRDGKQVKRLVADTMPDVVVNLASITTVRESFERPLETYKIGFWGTLNLLRALKDIGFTGRMLQIGSSEVYGFPSPEQLPISETEPLRPMSPYSVNKAATEALCYQWSQVESFEILMTRSFTHIGPGQSDRFAISNFAKQIAEIKSGQRKPVLYVGDLETTRDYTDVRDVVRAYDLLLQKGKNGNIYNVCSGIERPTRLLLNALLDVAGVTATISQDPSLTRVSEQRRVCGNNEKLIRDTGWHQSISIDITLSDILSHWEKNCCLTNLSSQNV